MPPGDIRTTQPINPVPFVIAVVAFLAVVVAAYVFLWEDDTGRLVQPDSVVVIDDDTIRVVATDRSACERIARVQVDLADDAVFVELVVEGGDADCVDVVAPLEADVTLPEPIGERDVRAGPGRLEIPCGEASPSATCRPGG